MNKINFYEKKYNALDIFYEWEDCGSEYDIAVEQAFYYKRELSEIDEMIYTITIATRYARSHRKISEQLKKDLKK